MRIVNRFLVVALLLAGCAGETAPINTAEPTSGLRKGADIVPWNPIHVAGPNKGTNACPICTYEALPAIQIFTKQNADTPQLVTRLEHLLNQEQKRNLKGFVIVTDSTPDRLRQMGEDLKIQNVGLCYPDPVTRDADLTAYKINPAVTDTVVLYKDYKVTANFVNLDTNNFSQLEAAVAKLP